MKKTMTSVDLIALAAPFALPDHEFRKAGAGEWLVYMTEGPLIQRLNEVDPCWEIRITENHVLRNTGAPDVVEVFGEMIIKGVVRANVGTDAAKTENVYDPPFGQDRKKVGEKFMPPDENTTKAATTDLLKRCARSFGVGSYILSCPRLKVQDERGAQTMFKTWYDGMFGTTPQPPKPAAAAPRKPVEQPAPKAEPEDAARAEHIHSQVGDDGTVPAIPAPQTPGQRRLPNGDEKPEPVMRILSQEETTALVEYMLELRPEIKSEKGSPRAHAGKACLNALKVDTWMQYKIATDNTTEEIEAARAKVWKYAAEKNAAKSEPVALPPAVNQ